jgi:pimeloyl-ACP methyl ester carboxylesterase
MKLAALLALGSLSCQPEPRRASAASSARAAPTTLPSIAAASSAPAPVFVDTLDVPGDQPVFALRGAHAQRAVGVVLHGWCSHGMGFLQAFQWAAVEVGPFIALQGEHRCGSGPMRGWAIDPAQTDRRIDAALTAYLGAAPPSEVVLVGSSQGAELAVALARRYPAKYRRLVLMSGPRPVAVAGLSGLQGAYFLVGEHESRAAAQRSRSALRAAGLAAELHVIAGGGHADFHGQGDALLREAFAFLRI